MMPVNMPFNGSANKLNKYVSYVLYRDEFTIFSHAFARLFGGCILHILFLSTGNGKIAKFAHWVTIGGFALHSFFILLRWRYAGHLMAYWYDSTSFLAWAIILIYLCIAHRPHLRPIGVFVVPAAFIATLVAYTLQAQENTAIPAYLQNYWLIAHSAVIFLSYATFIAAFGFGLMYLIEETKIRKKQHPLIYNLLPALGRSDELGHKCIFVGVILMTMGILIGVLWTRYVQEVKWTWIDSKVIFTIATWLIYVLQLSIRQVLGWRGRKTAYSAIIGFAAVLFTYVGVNLFLPSIHAF